MFYFEFGHDKKNWNFGSRPLPFTSFQFGELIITDNELLSDLAKVPKCDVVLEADISALGGSVKDKKYKRPANPAMYLIGEAVSGMICKGGCCKIDE